MPPKFADTRQNWPHFPDVILASGGSTVAPLLQATRTVSVVFPVTTDPVAAGFVESVARPGGNATGFMNFEYNIGEKWLELLKEMAPSMTRVAVLLDPACPPDPLSLISSKLRHRRCAWKSIP